MDTKSLQTVMNKSQDSMWRKCVVWGLGTLIVSTVIFLIIFSNTVDKERKLDWDLINTQNSGIVYDSVNSIAFDKTGRAWIGTFDGVSVTDGESWLSYTTENSALELTGADVNTIEVDSLGRIWISLAKGYPSNGGLIIVNGEVWEVFPATDLPWQGNVFSIAFDEDNQAWIGTDQGIHLYDGKTWTNLTPDNSGLISNSIRAIEFDQKGDAWIGTVDGLSHYDGESWRSFTEANSDITKDYICCIGFDQRGNTWIGWYGGASVFDGESWSHHSFINFYEYPDYVQEITSDSHGRILVSSGSALRIYDGELWKEYNTSNSGFPLGFGGHEIAIDPQGNIWMATGSGILVATVDNYGLPRFLFQDNPQNIFSLVNNLPRPYLLLAIIILSIFWFAILLNDSILVICGAVVAFFLISNIDEVGSMMVITATIGGIIGSFIRKLSEKPSLLPTKIGIIIGLVAGILLLGVGWFMAMSA